MTTMPCKKCPQVAGGCKSRCEAFRAYDQARLARSAAKDAMMEAMGPFFSHRQSRIAKTLRGVAVGHVGLYAR